MSKRLRLYDLRHSRLPGLIGLCKADVQLVADAVNAAQRRLLYAIEAGEEGWYGTWAEMIFQIDPVNPYLTPPREVARIERLTICDCPAAVQNQFYEYLQFGNGTLVSRCPNTMGSSIQAAYSRNNAITFVDLSDAPKYLRAYYTDVADVGKSVFLQGTDNNDATIYSLGAAGNNRGIFLKLTSPFVTSPVPFNSITGIQKDVTIGPVQIMQVDLTTGDEILLLTMDPGEQTASYRRYYFDQLPSTGCCDVTTGLVQVKAIVKLDLIPVTVDTDYCLIQNLEAIIAECESIRLGESDSSDAKSQARSKHKEAIGLLNGELAHYLGIDQPAIQFKPFGSATLAKASVGTFV